MTRGHRVRDGLLLPGIRSEKIPIVIVGGGMAGLSAAWKLERSGVRDFVVLELEDHAGGTSASGANQVSKYPWGAHYVPVPLPDSKNLIELLSEMGTIESIDSSGHPIVGEQFLCRAPQERLYHAGFWQEGLYPRYGASARDLSELAQFDELIDRFVSDAGCEWPARLRDPLPSSPRGAPSLDALDQMSMAEFLNQRGWRSQRLLLVHRVRLPR